MPLKIGTHDETVLVAEATATLSHSKPTATADFIKQYLSPAQHTSHGCLHRRTCGTLAFIKPHVHGLSCDDCVAPEKGPWQLIAAVFVTVTRSGIPRIGCIQTVVENPDKIRTPIDETHNAFSIIVKRSVCFPRPAAMPGKGSVGCLFHHQ